MLGLSVSSRNDSKGVDQGRFISFTVSAHFSAKFSILPSFFIGVANR